ncbi:MAG: CDP-diacylglycerol--glycerol-3-phosphate 3-phosphatidyltransferase [Candidatus Omnitrophica bacterium]|nr:CDP-diacylglycerol--glycerol-3-phosphate 3-phosphatidyltransferase [Candidatus Omnitrophota bacterium]
MNIANRITLFRIIATFVFMFFLSKNGLLAKTLSFIVFILAALSDYYDGFIARKKNIVSDFGKLMDPIADKILVLAAFAMFVQMRLVEAWMFVIIFSREILIFSLRLFALSKGKILATTQVGKHKTFSQMVVVFIILGFIIFKEIMLEFYTWNPAWEKFLYHTIYIVMLITVGLTIYSGISYLWKNRQIIVKI